MTRQVGAVWAVLVGVTSLSWALGSETGSRTASVVVLALACVKVRLVGRHFMEVADAHIALRILLDAYVAVLGTAMAGLYLAG
jgi:hypothetical protein